MNEELAKAIFAAGFRIGRHCGEDAATAYEWGSFSREPKHPDKAWDEYVKWMLTACSDPLDISNPKHWENVTA